MSEQRRIENGVIIVDVVGGGGTAQTFRAEENDPAAVAAMEAAIVAFTADPGDQAALDQQLAEEEAALEAERAAMREAELAARAASFG